MPAKELKAKLARGETPLGLFVSLESASITEIACELGLDWIVLDAEHGHLDYRDLIHHLRAAKGNDTAVLVRVHAIEVGLAKRVLDIGAHGVVFPWVRTAEDVRRAVAACKYPPRGVRGIGAERSTKWGMAMGRHVPADDDEVLVVPIIETREAHQHIEAIAAVEGVDFCFVGPADFSANFGHPGTWDEAPGMAGRIAEVKDALVRHEVPCSIVAGSTAEARRRIEEGFRLIALGADVNVFGKALAQKLENLGRPAGPEVWD